MNITLKLLLICITFALSCASQQTQIQAKPKPTGVVWVLEERHQPYPTITSSGLESVKKQEAEPIIDSGLDDTVETTNIDEPESDEPESDHTRNQVEDLYTCVEKQRQLVNIELATEAFHERVNELHLEVLSISALIGCIEKDPVFYDASCWYQASSDAFLFKIQKLIDDSDLLFKYSETYKKRLLRKELQKLQASLSFWKGQYSIVKSRYYKIVGKQYKYEDRFNCNFDECMSGDFSSIALSEAITFRCH